MPSIHPDKMVEKKIPTKEELRTLLKKGTDGKSLIIKLKPVARLEGKFGYRFYLESERHSREIHVGVLELFAKEIGFASAMDLLELAEKYYLIIDYNPATYS
ncbi:MAG: hypothetical protein WC629_02395 [Candidatus Paceibacterota bacterium]